MSGCFQWNDLLDISSLEEVEEMGLAFVLDKRDARRPLVES
jgi:hypothetical protein